MRAKEYINVHKQDLKHAEIVSQIIEDLQPLRMDKKATCEYMKNHLFADIRYQHYMLPLIPQHYSLTLFISA